MGNRKFKGKYKGGSRRLKGWDYSSEGLYFLTMVTKYRECNLGKIENEKMILSDFGEIVDTEWNKSFKIRNELFLHAYVIMPNHIHGIVEIRKKSNPVESYGRTIQRRRDDSSSIQRDDSGSKRDDSDPTINFDELKTIKRNIPERKPKSISSFIAGFKAAVNTGIDNFIDHQKLNIPKYNRQNPFFQSNFHDHIIRNKQEYQRIKKYIQHNIRNWKKDALC